MTKTSVDDFAALIRRAGLPIAPADVRELYQAWALVEPMLDRIRIPDRDRAAEPAHLFRADIYARHPGKTETF
jgi:hypothetical protein